MLTSEYVAKINLGTKPWFEMQVVNFIINKLA